MYEGILFDFDGVIADSEPLHFAAWGEALKPLGITLDWETYCANGIGLADDELLSFLGQSASPAVPLERLWERYPAKLALFRERCMREPPIPPATIEFLKSLNGYKLALVTSTARVEVEPVLERGGIKQRFQALVYGEDVARHKPAPDPYLLAAERLDIRSALVVEDSEAGLASGRAAGFDVVRVTEPRRMPEQVRARLGIVP